MKIIGTISVLLGTVLATTLNDVVIMPWRNAPFEPLKTT
jgi:hypothetical protein